MSSIDVRTDGWDIRGRWFGVVVAATPRLAVVPRSFWGFESRFVAGVAM
jgi:hypothetical protein